MTFEVLKFTPENLERHIKAGLMKAAYSLAECRASLLKAVFAEIEAAEKQETEA